MSRLRQLLARLHRRRQRDEWLDVDQTTDCP